MNINEFNKFIEAYKNKCLTKEKEAQLVLAIQRREDRRNTAIDCLMEANMYWSGMLVRDYLFTKMEPEDLWQNANIGLLQSIYSFDPSLGVPLHKYAENKMKSCILEGISQYGCEFNLPKPTQIQLVKLRKTISALTQQLCSEPTNDDIAEKMNLSIEEVSFLQTLNQRFCNIDDLYGSAGNSEVNDNSDVDINELGLETSSETETSLQINVEEFMDFDFLPPLDREIFIRSRGLMGFRVMTHAEILEDINNIRRDKGARPLVLEDIQIHYNRAVLLDCCRD